MGRSVLKAVIILGLTLAVMTVPACGSADTGESGEIEPAEENTPVGTGAAAETEVIGMPAGFPSDVPVHPGKVVAYDPIQVTDTTTVHQLSVETAASFDDVATWYQTALPAGWSAGYFENVGEQGVEAKIALDGGGYTPADPDGVGGGVLVGVQAYESTTLIVTTVTVMGSP
jgi:hypothetical protein